MEDRLFERDWQFLLDTVYRVNSIKDVDLFEKEALECLTVLMPCTQGTFFIPTEEDDRIVYKRPCVVGEKALFMDEFCTGAYERDPYFFGFGRFPETRTFRDSDFLPEEYRMNTPLYKEIYEPQGIHYALRSYLVHNQKIVGNISLFNSKDSGDFSDKSVLLLSQLAPHFALKLGDLLETERAAARQAKNIGAFFDLVHRQWHLTPREWEIASSLFTGESDQEIANRLCISLSTLKKHIYNIYKKIDVNNRTQLYASINSLLEKTI